MNYAIDKEGIARNLVDGAGLIAKGLYQADTPYATAENNYCAPYDRDKAIEILGAAGYTDPDGDGVREKGRMTYAYTDSSKIKFTFDGNDADLSEWERMQIAIYKNG
jgi:peptide/nickel transport system substrate-binding protein